MNDADIEMFEMEQVGRAIRAARRAGRCTHGYAFGYLPVPIYPQQIGLRPGQLACGDGCGTVFDSDDAWVAAMDAAIGY
jgi:hypothetical protein